MQVAFTTLLVTLCMPAQALSFLTMESAPFSYMDPATKEITGISTEMVAEAAKRAGIPYSLNLFPWMRTYSLVQADSDKCIYPLARLPEREALFKWVGPLTSNKWVLYAKNDFRGTIHNLSDAAKYSIGGVEQEGVTLFLKSHGMNVDVVVDGKLNLKKLEAHHIDLWATGLATSKAIAAKAGVNNIKVVMELKSIDHYLACNLNVHEETVDMLNQALTTMRNDNWIKKASERYPDY